MPRLFIALRPSDDAVDTLALTRGGAGEARWVEPDDYHVTLRFVGDVSGGDARALDRALSELRAEPALLRYTGFGAFGGNRPRALHAVLERTPSLTALQAKVERAALQAEMEPERRKFAPHITLARLRGASAGLAADWLSRRGPPGLPDETVHEVGLYSARESVGGGPYILEASYTLDGS